MQPFYFSTLINTANLLRNEILNNNNEMQTIPTLLVWLVWSCPVLGSWVLVLGLMSSFPWAGLMSGPCCFLETSCERLWVLVGGCRLLWMVLVLQLLSLMILGCSWAFFRSLYCRKSSWSAERHHCSVGKMTATSPWVGLGTGQW